MKEGREQMTGDRGQIPGGRGEFCLWVLGGIGGVSGVMLGGIC